MLVEVQVESSSEAIIKLRVTSFLSCLIQTVLKGLELPSFILKLTALGV
jgi:hypothetical protein